MDVESKLMEICVRQFPKFKEFQKKGTANASFIFKILRSRSKYSLSRFQILDSIGVPSRREGFPQPDFDLVVFINGQKPPFTQILEDFKNSLCAHFAKNNKEDILFDTASSKLTTTPNSSYKFDFLNFRIKDISAPKDEKKKSFISFHIFVAMNLLSPEEEEKVRFEKREQIQTQRALNLIVNLPDPLNDSWMYEHNFAERYSSFLKVHSAFVRHLVRLAKLWNRTVIWESNEILVGRSKLIELVMILTATTEEIDAGKENREESIQHAFHIFLSKLINFDDFLLQLLQCEKNQNLRIPPKNEKHFAMEVDEETVPDSVTSITNISDPSNPFHNLGARLTSEMKTSFKSRALETMTAIQNFYKWDIPGLCNLFGI